MELACLCPCLGSAELTAGIGTSESAAAGASLTVVAFETAFVAGASATFVGNLDGTGGETRPPGEEA